ncbi:hypothetical protein [Lapillicoccus jejuensis]|uniref:HTH cro/C1-type domain-containing protein n=1 Tax=Lapillicoccus jejuensis TaxID=402171 RepID=A0A542E3P4_9MICO|nr:hypothetical protein [Lapillicoccus jejuensis]TQJ09960.1 hypothetical protein FB458_3077 [Lapillicoccus jejuensis]
MGERTTAAGDSLAETIGWVLGNARDHARDRSLRTAAGFSQRISPPVHRAQVGRWESGATGITFRQVRQYEDVLGLPEGLLLATIDNLARGHGASARQPSLPPPLADDWRDRVDDLLDKAESPERMTGLEWRWLASALGSSDDVFLRRRDWEHLLRRIATEADLCTGLEYQLRDDAKACLASHPRSARTVLDLTESVFADPTAPVYAETGILLAHAAGHEAVDLLMRLLRDPVGEAAHYTLLWVARVLVLEGRTRISEDEWLAAHAVEVLEDAASSPRQRDAAGLLLEVVPGPRSAQVAEWLRRIGDRRVADAVEHGRVLGERQLDSLLEEIQARLAATTGKRPTLHPVLRSLLWQATAHAATEVRGTALTVLMLSPQGPVIGATYASALRYALAHGPDVVVDEALIVLSWLLAPQDVPTVLELGLDPAVDASRAGQALVAVGNARDRIDEAPPGYRADDVTARLVRSARERMGPGDGPGVPTPEPLVRGHLYALGMLGRFDALEELAPESSRPGVDPVWGAGARRWLSTPVWARPPRA